MMQVTQTQFDSFSKEIQENLIKNGVQIISEAQTFQAQPVQSVGLRKVNIQQSGSYTAIVKSATLNFKAVSGDDAVYGDATIEFEGVTPENFEAVIIDLIGNRNFPITKIYNAHREKENGGFRKDRGGDNRRGR